jgi:putative phosphoribosyl transferase
MHEDLYELEGTAAAPLFRDRLDAGRRLASLLARSGYAGRSDVLVLGLPRGGVPVAAEVARALGAPLDALPIRKLGVPGVEEMAMGAVAGGGITTLIDYVVAYLGVPAQLVERVAERERRELARRERLYRGGRSPPDIRGKTVIVVDDGLAMGASFHAAAAALRAQAPAEIVAATPVAWRSSCDELRPRVDRLVAVAALDPFHTVSHWYRDFAPTSDEEVCALLGMAAPHETRWPKEEGDVGGPAPPVSIPIGAGAIEGDLLVPGRARSVIVLAHGSGSSRRSYRNRYTAAVLREEGFGTLLLDLLTREEQARDAATAEVRFDVRLLGDRLVAVTDWLGGQAGTRGAGIGYVGSSTGGTATLMAAAERPGAVGAIVSRGGRADLADEALTRVAAPTLFVVGEHDADVLAATRKALGRVRASAELAIVPGAGHVFEEPGALGEAARLTTEWLRRWLPGPSPS